MSLSNLNLPFPDFKNGDIINPDEFNSNNLAIKNKVNELVNVANTGGGGDDGENIFLPSYITETYIDAVEIKSPKLTGNTFVGSTGMVGMSSNGSSGSDIRMWAGSTNKNTAPFRVSHNGEVNMTKANIRGEFMTYDSYNMYRTSRLYSNNPSGGRLDLNSVSGGQSVEIGDFAQANAVGGNAMFYSLSPSGNSMKARIGVHPDANSGMVQLTNELGKRTVVLYGGSNLGNYGLLSLNSADETYRIQLHADGTSYIKGKLAIGGVAVDSNSVAQINGNLNVVGDIYINGVKMKLTPA